MNVPHSASALAADDFAFIRDVVGRNFAGNGEECQRLRDRLASLCQRKHVILTSSGTAALELSLLALGARDRTKRQVVTSAYVCPAVANAIAAAGLEAVFADCKSDSLSLGAAQLAAAVSAQTAAVVLTNLGGIPDDYDLPPGIPVVSDCAQALGTLIDGVPLTALGDVAVVSFGPTKIVTGGGGGAVLCDDDALAAIVSEMARPELPVSLYRERGFVTTRGQHFSDINAGLVLSQLGKLPGFIAWRRAIAARYDEVLAGVDVRVVHEGQGVQLNRYRYYILAEDAAGLIAQLRSVGIDARDSLAHRTAGYVSAMDEPRNISSLAARVVSLPIHCQMSAADVELVALTLQSSILGRKEA
jgi:perosamine synthetase